MARRRRSRPCSPVTWPRAGARRPGGSVASLPGSSSRSPCPSPSACSPTCSATRPSQPATRQKLSAGSRLPGPWPRNPNSPSVAPAIASKWRHCSPWSLCAPPRRAKDKTAWQRRMALLPRAPSLESELLGDTRAGAFSDDLTTWAAGTQRGEVIVGRVADGAVLARWQAVDSPVRSLAFHPGGRLLAVGAQQAIAVWEVNGQDPPRRTR